MAADRKAVGIAVAVIVSAAAACVILVMALSDDRLERGGTPKAGSVAGGTTRPGKVAGAATTTAATEPDDPEARQEALLWTQMEGSLRRMVPAGRYGLGELVELGMKDGLLAGTWKGPAKGALANTRVEVPGSGLLWTMERGAEGVGTGPLVTSVCGWDFGQKNGVGIFKVELQVVEGAAGRVAVTALYGGGSPVRSVKYTQEGGLAMLAVAARGRATLSNGEGLLVTSGKTLRAMQEQHPMWVQEYLAPALAAVGQGEVLGAGK